MSPWSPIPPSIPSNFRVNAVDVTPMTSFKPRPRVLRIHVQRTKGAGAVKAISAKAPEELDAEFAESVRVAQRPGRDVVLNSALEEILSEPSMAHWRADRETATHEVDAIVQPFRTMSSGQKIALSIIAHLCAYVDRRSLVVLDEPESHLHPSLLASLLRRIPVILKQTDSHAIIATYSPVVLQELPARSVQIIDMNFGFRSVRRPEIETFAENLEAITTHVFRLDSSKSDYHETLRELARRPSTDWIEEIFPGGLPARAMSYVFEQRRRMA